MHGITNKHQINSKHIKIYQKKIALSKKQTGSFSESLSTYVHLPYFTNYTLTMIIVHSSQLTFTLNLVIKWLDNYLLLISLSSSLSITSSTQLVSSVQSAWSPHFHPVECRENNQVSNEFLPGRRQVHLFFTFLRHSH